MRSINPEKLETFCAIYAPALLAIVSDPSNGYCYGPSAVPGVVEKMRRAIVDGSYNHDGKALQATCKALGIRHTRKAIDAFLAS